jgi:hypothetical protein
VSSGGAKHRVVGSGSDLLAHRPDGGIPSFVRFRHESYWTTKMVLALLGKLQLSSQAEIRMPTHIFAGPELGVKRTLAETPRSRVCRPSLTRNGLGTWLCHSSCDTTGRVRS